MTESKKPSKSKQELLPQVNEKPTDISVFLPVIEKWLEGQREDARLGHEVGREELNVVRQSNHYSFWLLVTIVIAVFALAIGLIFIKNNLDAGLSVLSHVGAIVAGLLAGMGFERTRRHIDE